jgi:putative DNA primase/helicase
MFDIHEKSRGRWRGILSTFGLTQQNLSGKHGPCPVCQEGRDRFRFDDKDGKGTWICSHCGAGSGFDLVMKIKGWDFKTAVNEIRPMIGAIEPTAIKAGLSDEQKRRMRIELWQESVPITKGDPVDTYLARRGIDEVIYPKTLRFHPNCRYSEGLSFPAMIAAVQDADGNGVLLHRTFLKDGDKAPVDSPRMMMPGTLPPGSAVRLSDVSETLGIAEGIETAMRASARFDVPVWAALNANMLAEWIPPAGVTEVAIFGDNDPKFAGQAAAYQLARRLANKKFAVTVSIPSLIGKDWADDFEE